MQLTDQQITEHFRTAAQRWVAEHGPFPDNPAVAQPSKPADAPTWHKQAFDIDTPTGMRQLINVGDDFAVIRKPHAVSKDGRLPRQRLVCSKVYDAPKRDSEGLHITPLLLLTALPSMIMPGATRRLTEICADLFFCQSAPIAERLLIESFRAFDMSDPRYQAAGCQMWFDGSAGTIYRPAKPFSEPAIPLMPVTAEHPSAIPKPTEY